MNSSMIGGDESSSRNSATFSCALDDSGKIEVAAVSHRQVNGATVLTNLNRGVRLFPTQERSFAR
jgi:hypothetical protein